MKTIIALSLTIATAIAGVLVSSNDVLAATAMHSGSICHNYNSGEANDPDFYVDGVKNSSTATRYVICPLVVTHTSGQTTGSVYVDFNTTVAMSCTLYSYNDNDVFLGSKSATTGTGSARYIYIGTVPASTYSHHSVLCSLPANRGGKIVAIESNF